MSRYLLLLLLIVVGCADQKLETAALAPQEDSSEQDSPEQVGAACVQRLLETPPTGDAAMDFDAAAATNAIGSSLPIPAHWELASDIYRYELMVDETSGRAWLVREGGIGGNAQKLLGPWPTSHEDVQMLLGLLDSDIVPSALKTSSGNPPHNR